MTDRTFEEAMSVGPQPANERNSIRRFGIVAVCLFATLSVGLLAGKDYGRFAIIVCAYLIPAALWSGRPESLAVFQFALSPLASYFLRWPIEKSVLTFDRVMILLIVLSAAALIRREKGLRLRVGAFELCWLAFSLSALADCFRQGILSTYNLKIAADALLLPLPLFIAARSVFDLDRIKKGVLFALIALGLGLLPIGLYELFTGIDILRYSGSKLFWDGLIRPNGPFASNNSYAIISLIIGLALIHWPGAAGIRIEGSLRIVRAVAVACALAASLVPQFRAVAVATVFCPALGLFLRRGPRAVLKPVIAGALILTACLPALWLISSSDYARRHIGDPANAYSRIEAYKIGLRTVRDNFMWGVGLGLYKQYFDRHYIPKEGMTDRYYDSVSIPHNNYLTVFAELGVFGFIFYTAANLLLLYESFRLWRRGDDEGRERGAAALALFTAYTGVGLTLTSGYYADLNLTFFFLMGLFLNHKGHEEH